MAFGAEHVEAAGGQRLLFQPRDLFADLGGARILLAFLRIDDIGQFLADAHVGIAAELNVGAAAGHVGRDRDRARHTGLRNNVRLLLVIARVEDGEDLGLGRALVARIKRGERVGIGEVVLLPAFLAQHFRKLLGFLDRSRAHKHRLAARFAFLDQRDDSAVFLHAGPIDLVIVVDADHRHVGRNFQHFEIVNVLEFVGLGRRRAGHAGKLLVHPEVVLEGDRGQRLVFRLDRLVLFGFERLMQAFGIAAARHHAAGKFVDDDDFAVAHDVVFVALEQLVGA